MTAPTFYDPFSTDNLNKLQPSQINAFHAKSDKDASSVAQHHTLGLGANQASPGHHNHDGRNSKRIFDGFTVVGSKGGNAALTSLISVLAQLGLTDGTT